jgi:hypothetical protein
MQSHILNPALFDVPQARSDAVEKRLHANAARVRMRESLSDDVLSTAEAYFEYEREIRNLPPCGGGGRGAAGGGADDWGRWF